MATNIRKKETKFQTKENGESGITLVALVISIIVLLILAGVTIVTLTGDNGLLQKAGEAKNTTLEAEGLEKIQLAVMASHDKDGINTTSLAKNLSEINGLTDTSNQEITENTEITLPTIIKLNDIQYIIKQDGDVEKIIEGKLPSIYKQVEYIESSGKQYIDTLVQSKSTLKIILDARIKEIISGVGNAIFGVNNDDGGSFAYQINGNSKMLRCDFNIKREEYSSYKVIEDTRHLWKKDKNINYVDNTIVYTNTNSEFQSQYNIYIFGKYSTNNFCLSKIKVYHCEIYDNDILERDLIPCYSTITGAIGMYDTVEGKFYINQGTGTFGYETDDGTYVAPTNN